MLYCTVLCCAVCCAVLGYHLLYCDVLGPASCNPTDPSLLARPFTESTSGQRTRNTYGKQTSFPGYGGKNQERKTSSPPSFNTSKRPAEGRREEGDCGTDARARITSQSKFISSSTPLLDAESGNADSEDGSPPVVGAAGGTARARNGAWRRQVATASLPSSYPGSFPYPPRGESRVGKRAWVRCCLASSSGTRCSKLG